MRKIKLEENTITFDGHKANATWSPKMFDELKEFHNVDLKGDVADMLVQELQFEFDLTPAEKVYCKKEILEHIAQ